MKDWNYIKKEIYHQEEPLSKAELAAMKSQLHAPKPLFRRWALVFSFLLLGGLSFWYWPSSTTSSTKESLTQEAAPKEPLKTKDLSDKGKNQFVHPRSNSKAIRERKIPKAKQQRGKEIAQELRNQSSRSETAAFEAYLGKSPKQNRAELISPMALRNIAETQAPNGIRALPKAIPFFGHLSFDAPRKNSTALNQRPPQSALSFKAYAGYAFALNQASALGQAQQQHFRFDELKQQTGFGGGMTYGLEGHFKLLPFMRLGLGLEFFELQQFYAFNHKISEIPVVDSASGNILGYLSRSEAIPVQESGYSAIAYWGLPLSLYYEIPMAEQWSLGAEARYTHFFNLYARGRQLDPRSLSLEDFSRESAGDFGSLRLNLALNYQIRPHVLIGLESTYQHFLGALYRNAHYRWQPQLAGLQFQIIYQIPKT